MCNFGTKLNILRNCLKKNTKKFCSIKYFSYLCTVQKKHMCMKRLNLNQKRYFEKIWYIVPNITYSSSLSIDVIRNGKIVKTYNVATTRYFVDEIPTTSYDQLILHYNGKKFSFQSMVTIYNTLIQMH